MPNTLAHMGAQGVLTRFAIRDADPKWIYLGCIIPDVPWILQRVVTVAAPGVDLYALRAYAIVQASLFGCLILCAALALLTRKPGRMYGILALNAVLHLVLDALQTKWANGVHFFAPWSWTMTNWGLFWPESLTTYVLTGLGLAYVLWHGRRSIQREAGVKRPTVIRSAWIMLLLMAYFLMPFPLARGPVEADNHYLKTLREPGDRPGRYVECDRARFSSTTEADVLTCWNAEDVGVSGLENSAPATVSVRGRFISENELYVLESHVHSDWFRDSASYVGLIATVVLWTLAGAHDIRLRRTAKKSIRA